MLLGSINTYSTLGAFFVIYIILRHLRDIIQLDKKTFTRCLTVICVAAVACSLIFNAFIGTIVFCIILAVLYSQLPRPLLTVANKAVLITGCDSGIVGYSLACHLDRLGFKVFAGCKLQNSDGEKQLKSQCSDRVITLQLDVTKDEQIQHAVKFVCENMENGEYIWGVINAASIVRIADFEMFPTKELQREFEVNALGQFCVCKAFIPLIRQSRGRFVNFTFSGNFASERTVAHTMSTYAVEGMSHVLRLEMKKWGVDVCMVQPPFRETDIISESGVQDFHRCVNEEITEEQQHLYGKDYLDHLMQAVLAKTSPSITFNDLFTIANAVTEALLSQKPCFKYHCGMDYTLYGVLSSIAPGDFIDRIGAYMVPRLSLNVTDSNVNKKDQ
ncbi:D-beta-hydroxybutyrate dehydrogenase, mitochondrial-like isoform X1 [Ptychodera flava]|uniref:D-beta-hydroxybutyrate dehydrogenase, mitochondrial-like isoform X1 n=1 Tax=Ptychodera flava TaxID=63121 RepID=UPI00396A6BFD